MASRYDSLEAALAESWPAAAWRDLNVVVAVSGGADSVALLHGLLSAKEAVGGTGRLFVGHFDHRLRPDASADAAWVADLSRRLGVPCELGAADVVTSAAAQGDGLENAARISRYAFLTRVAERVGARYVAVAHTHDDQVETVLHRILRGTGLLGLEGMPKSRPLSHSVVLVRPLLLASRPQVLDYLQRIGQDFRSDLSNIDVRFTRNRIRQQLLPLLRAEFNQDVDGAILRLATQAGEAQEVIALAASKLYAESAIASRCHVEIDCRLLAKSPPHLVREVCRLAWEAAGLPMQSMGYDEWNLLAAMISGDLPKSANLPGAVTAVRNREQIVITQAP